MSNVWPTSQIMASFVAGYVDGMWRELPWWERLTMTSDRKSEWKMLARISAEHVFQKWHMAEMKRRGYGE